METERDIETARESISVIICAYKNAHLTRRCLESLEKAFDGKLPETVLVDDAAGDAETASVAADFPEAKFVVMPENGGFAAANNRALPYCTKPFVALVNNDIVFREDPFATLVKFMDEHPKCGMAQGTILIKNWKDGPEWLLDGCGGMLTPFGTLATPGWLEPTSAPIASTARRCFSPSGAMLLLRRAAIEDVGRLFYDFFHSYYEEIDFSHRAHLRGWEAWYVPTTPVEHVHSATFSKFADRSLVMRRFYRNMRFTLATCLGTRGRLLVRPAFELLCLGQVLVQLLRGKTFALRAHAWAVAQMWKMRRLVSETRKGIQSRRNTSDTRLFRAVMQNYSLQQFIAAAKGNA
ncbi:MAG: glycosyltransferase [Kiritimatiellae bacterium]|nr:glycosyltransferase [Kiritimatiellia bacterium]